MNPPPVDRMDLLELLPERRYVALSQAEAAELGSDALGEWREACADGVHLDGQAFLALCREARRWQRLADIAEAATEVVGVVVVISIVLGALGLISWWWR